MLSYLSCIQKKEVFSMKELGTITIRVTKDSTNNYSFNVYEDNEDLCYIRYVIEDTLKKY